MSGALEPAKLRLDRSGLRWNRTELESRGTWRVDIPAEVVAEVGRCLVNDSEMSADVERIRRELPELTALATSARANLQRGDGVVWLRAHGRFDSVAEPVQRGFFEAFGRAMGQPITTYGTLYEVKDRGREYRQEAIPISQTRAATGFHTDSSNLGTLPDLVGLFCLEPSSHGGDSLVTSGLRAHDRLAAGQQGLWRRLFHPFVRDLVTPGAPDDRASLLANRIPVFAEVDRPGGVDVRYMRYWIERGQEKVGEPLSEGDLAAMNALDRELADPDHVVRFALARGDSLWVNNRAILHNRTDYRDEPGHMRRLLRMWVGCG